MGRYATLPARINAGTLDALLLLALFLVAPVALEHAPTWLRAAAMYGPVLFLEPLLIRLFGRTVGQALLGLRVEPLRGSESIPFARLVLRYWLKVVLGLFSAVYLTFNRHRQTLHDDVCGTVVVVAGVYPACPLPEGQLHPHLPSPGRRFAIFLLWYCGITGTVVVVIHRVAALLRTHLGTVVFKGDLFAQFVDLFISVTACCLFILLARSGVAGRLPGARLAPQALSE